jgi:hypothetical protein
MATGPIFQCHENKKCGTIAIRFGTPQRTVIFRAVIDVAQSGGLRSLKSRNLKPRKLVLRHFGKQGGTKTKN